VNIDDHPAFWASGAALGAVALGRSVQLQDPGLALLGVTFFVVAGIGTVHRLLDWWRFR
jgi:hypothetical protein